MDFNRKCNACSLSSGCAVSWAGSENPIGIIISDYPGNYEVKTNKSLVSLSKYPKGRIVRGMNAGSFLDALLYKITKGKSNAFYRTNLIKCKIEIGVTPSLNQKNTCKSTWLDRELNRFPGIPMLIAGGMATKHILGEPLEKCRGIKHNYSGHPTMVTYNPIQGSRTLMFDDNGKLLPFIKGSAPDEIAGDLVDFYKICKQVYKQRKKKS